MLWSLVWAVNDLFDHEAGLPTIALIIGSAFAVFASFYLNVDDSNRSNPNSVWSLCSAAQLVVLLVLGPAIAIVSAILASCLRDAIDRKKILVSVENAGTDAVVIWLSGLTYLFLGGTNGELQLPGSYAPILGTAVVLSVAQGLLYAMLSLHSHAHLNQGVTRDAVNRLPTTLRNNLLECLIGVAVASVYLVNPWVLPVVGPLALSFYISMRRGHKLQQVTDRALETFANIVDERDSYTFQHSTRVCEYSMKIGEALYMSEQEMQRLYWTSRLHDLGKLAVDNSILNKPGKLTDEEFEIMKTHPIVSARILSSFSFNEVESEIVLCHHERYDGRGYLRREAASVPFESFIIAVADSFDAMTSDRPYRKGMSHTVAFEEIYRNIGSQFEPRAANAFLDAMNYTRPEVMPLSSHDDLGSAGTGRLTA